MYKIKIYESLFENGPEDEDLKMEIIDTFTQIGNLYAEAGDRDQAKEYYEKAIEGYEMLLSENPESTDFEIGISDVLTALGGDMYAKVEHEDVESEDETEDAEFEIAREYYEKALKLNEKEFGRYPDDSTCQDELVRTLGKIGDSFAAQERYIDAVPYYRRIIEIKEQAVRDNPVEWIYIMTLTNSLYQLGYLYGQIGEIELEKQQYSKAEELFSRLLHDEKISLPVKQILAFDVQGRGIDLLNSRKYDSAKGALDLALEFFENEYEKTRKSRKTILSYVKHFTRVEGCNNPWRTLRKRLKSLIHCSQQWKNCSNQIPKIPKMPNTGKKQESIIPMPGGKCIILSRSMKNLSSPLKEPWT